MEPDGFVGLLRAAGVASVVDVRSHPGSRRHPWFGKGEMERWLPAADVAYHWERELGGFRKPNPDSPNTALRVGGFRGYADHMRTDGFRKAVERLLDRARRLPTAVMCAESMWWRCHRSFLADAVVLVYGVEVAHIMPDGTLRVHRPRPEARVDEEGRIVYDRGGGLPA